ncbi:MAG: hypothetical protein ISS25_04930 [Nanoarchaeota archaeon]|nr:hypothetical protein [DPANN group archaeon]MBL7117144.1 hypothetical protein [Nanoarchaeota archaeon]
MLIVFTNRLDSTELNSCQAIRGGEEYKRIMVGFDQVKNQPVYSWVPKDFVYNAQG